MLARAELLFCFVFVFWHRRTAWKFDIKVKRHCCWTVSTSTTLCPPSMGAWSDSLPACRPSLSANVTDGISNPSDFQPPCVFVYPFAFVDKSGDDCFYKYIYYFLFFVHVQDILPVFGPPSPLWKAQLLLGFSLVVWLRTSIYILPQQHTTVTIRQDKRTISLVL
jgi:hypothetical protein